MDKAHVALWQNLLVAQSLKSKVVIIMAVALVKKNGCK